MSSMVNTFNPVDHVRNTFRNIKSGDIGQAIIDPGDAFSTGKAAEEKVERAAAKEVAAAEAEVLADAQADAKNAARAESAAKKKAASTTSTVLTSALGSSSTTQAIAKLGGR